MKTIFLFLAVLTSYCSAITIEQLKECASEAALIQERKNPTPEQMNRALIFTGYHQGFIDSVTSASYAVINDRYEVTPAKVYMPSRAMYDPYRSASSILDFISKHYRKDTKPFIDTPQSIMMAWFLWNCKDADAVSKDRAVRVLEIGLGSNFPGKDEMLSEVLELKRQDIERGGRYHEPNKN